MRNMDSPARLVWTAAFLAVCIIMLAACGGGGDNANSRSSTSTSTALPTTPGATPTASSSVKDEVSAAYLHYWDVYADAVYNLDETRLQGVMTGPQLQRTREEIGSLRQRGRAAKIVVEHNFFVADLDVAAGTATIRDEYTNSSYEIDAVTKEMVGAAAHGTVVSDNYFLVKDGEVWKVRDGTRQGA